MHLVNLEASYPLYKDFNPTKPPTNPIALAQRTAVLFIETYKDVEAFGVHMKGPVFHDFQRPNVLYFFNSAPILKSTGNNSIFLDQESGFIREDG